jgi:hypothetical protein
MTGLLRRAGTRTWVFPAVSSSQKIEAPRLAPRRQKGLMHPKPKMLGPQALIVTETRSLSVTP